MSLIRSESDYHFNEAVQTQLWENPQSVVQVEIWSSEDLDSKYPEPIPLFSSEQLDKLASFEPKNHLSHEARLDLASKVKTRNAEKLKTQV